MSWNYAAEAEVEAEAAVVVLQLVTKTCQGTHRAEARLLKSVL